MRFVPAITAAVLATGLAAAPAMAASNGYMDSGSMDNGYQGGAGAPAGNWMSIGAIADQFTQKGYIVRGVEVDDGRYEVEATDPNGMMIEAYVDPVTGNILRQKRDD
jgi:hypothetical protein